MKNNLSKFIDHTILKPTATEKGIIKLCEEAKDNNFISVCINPCYVSLAKEQLDGSNIKVCTVIGFPLGANTTQIKSLETKDAFARGADEFDMVINIGALKDKKYDYVKNDIEAVVEAAQGRTVKVIIETFYLTDEEKAIASRLSCEAGADFVKTCTGFNDGVATIEDLKIMKANIYGDVKLKASAGIRSYKSAKALIDAGAQRLGTSAGMAILAQEKVLR